MIVPTITVIYHPSDNAVTALTIGVPRELSPENKLRAVFTDHSNIFSAIFTTINLQVILRSFITHRIQLTHLCRSRSWNAYTFWSRFYDLKLGRLMLHKAIGNSKAEGDKGMWLEVWRGNERTLRFYLYCTPDKIVHCWLLKTVQVCDATMLNRFSKARLQKNDCIFLCDATTQSIKQGFQTVGETSFWLTATHSNPAWVMMMEY